MKCCGIKNTQGLLKVLAQEAFTHLYFSHFPYPCQ